MTHMHPAPQPAEARRTKKKPVKAAATVGGLLLLVLASCGTGMAMGSEEGGTPQPTATETVEVPGEEKTVEVPGPERTVEKEVPVTPEACLTALDLSEQGFDLASQTISIMNEALQAAASLNVAGIEAATAQLEVLQPQLDAITGPLNEAKAECRAS